MRSNAVCVRCLPWTHPSSHSRKRVEESEAHKLIPQHGTQDSSCGRRTPFTSTCSCCGRVDTQGRRIDVKEQRRETQGQGHPLRPNAQIEVGSRKRRARASACVVFLLMKPRRFFLHFVLITIQCRQIVFVWKPFVPFVVFAASSPPSARDSQLHAPGIRPPSQKAELGDELYFFHKSLRWLIVREKRKTRFLLVTHSRSVLFPKEREEGGPHGPLIKDRNLVQRKQFFAKTTMLVVWIAMAFDRLLCCYLPDRKGYYVREGNFDRCSSQAWAEHGCVWLPSIHRNASKSTQGNISVRFLKCAMQQKSAMVLLVRRGSQAVL